jgi:hypothetical protein
MEELGKCVSCGMEQYTLADIYICSDCLQAEKRGYALQCFNTRIENLTVWQHLKL